MTLKIISFLELMNLISLILLIQAFGSYIEF